ncbi:MAG: potassium transporter, partial [Gammaproteobacteria bacterium]|nr:potassium transporter [Gammaproteobacteria bacterium]
MQLFTIQKIVGLLLMIFSATMLPPIVIDAIVAEGAWFPFAATFFFTFLCGTIVWYPARESRDELSIRDGFMVVVLFWTVLSLFGALPFIFSSEVTLSLAGAVFESISGLTTTGATVITHIDGLPKAILYYRQQLQWLGGMGIIVLAVAILPMLGIGGMQLYRAETPGPVKDSRLTPRITETAKALWYIYLGLTLLCTLFYWLAGMTPFDALGHSFSTVAIGGFSTHDASMGYYQDQPFIEVVAIIFMLLSGINFALHFVAFHGNSSSPLGYLKSIVSGRGISIAHYFRDEELNTYLIVLGVVAIITSTLLYTTNYFSSVGDALLHGVFQAVSIGTTTGFTTSDYAHWPSFLPVMLLFASFIGGCAGSTGGGMKVIRFLLLIKQGRREIVRLIHPNAVIPIKLGGRRVSWKVIDAVWGFFATYVALFALMLLALMLTGLDQVSALSAT